MRNYLPLFIFGLLSSVAIADEKEADEFADRWKALQAHEKEEIAKTKFFVRYHCIFVRNMI